MKKTILFGSLLTIAGCCPGERAESRMERFNRLQSEWQRKSLEAINSQKEPDTSEISKKISSICYEMYNQKKSSLTMQEIDMIKDGGCYGFMELYDFGKFRARFEY